jgi:hypothetical protein
MFCIITNQTEANVWLTSVALDQPLRRLILVTYASSQWRGKKFLIEHVVNVKTLNGSEHDGRSFFFHFFIEIENFRGERKMLMRHNFFWKNSWFLQNFRRERTVFHFIFYRKRKIWGGFQHLWSARRKLKKNITFWKKWSERIQRTKT